MTTSEYTIHLPGALSIGISSTGELPLGADEQLLLGAYLPQPVIESGIASTVDRLVEHVESDHKGLRQHGSEVTVHDTWQDTFPTDLPHLLHGIARAAWIERGIFPAHAACVTDGIGAEATLLPGPSGTGKSTTALALAIRHGYRIASGNTTLVQITDGAMTALAGTRTMSLQTSDFEHSNIPTAASLQYGERTAFTLPPEYYTTGMQRIGRLALVRLTDRQPQQEDLSPASALHRIYPHLLHSSRQDIITCDGHGLYTSQDPPATRRQLVDNMRQVLHYTPATALEGPLHYILGGIAI